MAEAVLFSLSNDILKSLAIERSKPGGKMQLLFCAKDELQSLEGTIQTIRAVLLDAEKQQWHDNQVKHWLGRLKDVLYDVQDLLDDVNTEDLRRKITPDDKTSKVVRNFFSKSNQFAYRLKVANKIRELRKKLDRIKNDREFRLEEHQKEETLVMRSGKKIEIPSPDEKIIGREEDKRTIKQLLFGSSSSQNVSFVAIVGKRGLGKTTLAQLVYNDGEVKQHFKLKMWVCLSTIFDVNLIIKEILKSAKDDCQRRNDVEMKKILQDIENKPIKQLPSLLRKILRREKYLLVLDDLWNENRDKWLKLREWLEGSVQGSKILVLTRNDKVVKATDANSAVHHLPGLSEDKSWNLFRQLAFGDGVSSFDLEMEKIGQDIVYKCAGIPLAIIIIGCVLYGKEKDEWFRYERELPEIPKIDEDDNGILRVLKFSYDHLPSNLKNCFAYCSLFPKDYVYNKEEMIYLWMAQGFIESPNENDNLEEVANDYLSELLCRSFLNAASKRDDGVVLTFKMHDLMHDLARKVAGDECKTIDFKGEDNDGRVRHGSFISKESSKEKMVSLLKTSKWRTFIYMEGEYHILIYDKVFLECRHCRALVLVNTDIALLSSSFENLKHLRFLNISGNRIIHSLPDSITDLVNLQFLKLVACRDFETFPRDLRKLINLRYLEIGWCGSLNHLPFLSELLSLRTLILHHLHELKFVQQTSKLEQSDKARSFFPSLERLSLHSCSNLEGWWGRRRRSDESWSSFPKLRSVEILACPCLTSMPPFPQVEYLETDSSKMLEQQLMANPNNPSEAAVESTIFTPFSKLKRLHLSGGNLEPSMPETLLRLASNLKSMSLYNCDLRSLSFGMRHLSSLQELDIHACDGLGLMSQEDEHGNQWRFLAKLRVLKISHHSDLVALPEGIQHVTTLQSLEISSCQDLKSLPEWIGSLSLLEKLVLSDCPSLMHLPFDMSNLTCLKELRILNCPALEERCPSDGQEDSPMSGNTSVIVWEDEL